MTTTAAPGLAVTSLVVRGRGGLALGPLSFSVRSGEAIAVLGSAGAGKSLLLSALAGLVAARGDIVRPPRIAMVFQRDALDDTRSALDNVAAACAARGIDDPRGVARAALGGVGLAGDVDKLPRRMSGGMKKRVGIARALAVRPQLLLADDPTAGLDPDTAAEVLALLVGADDAAARVLVIATQDVDVVLPRVPQAIVLGGGGALFLGAPAQLGSDVRARAFAAVASPGHAEVRT